MPANEIPTITTSTTRIPTQPSPSLPMPVLLLNETRARIVYRTTERAFVPRAPSGSGRSSRRYSPASRATREGRRRAARRARALPPRARRPPSSSGSRAPPGRDTSRPSSAPRCGSWPTSRTRLGLLLAELAEDLLGIARPARGRWSRGACRSRSSARAAGFGRLPRARVRRGEHERDRRLERRETPGDLARPPVPVLGQRPVGVPPGGGAVLGGGVPQQPDFHAAPRV